MINHFVKKKDVLILFSDVDTISSTHHYKNNGGYIMNICLNEPNKKLTRNLYKLDRISQLQFNWDCYEANPLPLELVQAAKSLIQKLYIQPQIFPTAAGSIQIEYEKDNGDYLEIQFTGIGFCEVFRYIEDNEEYFSLPDNSNSINVLVDNFYGRSS